MVSLQIVIVSLKQSTMFIRYVCKEKRLFCFNKIEWYRNSFEFQDFHLLIGPTLPFIIIHGITILWVLIDYTLVDVTFAWLLDTLNSTTSSSTKTSFKEKNSSCKTKRMNNFYSPEHSQNSRLSAYNVTQTIFTSSETTSPRRVKKWSLKIAFNPRLQSFWEDWSVWEVIKQATQVWSMVVDKPWFI